MTNTLETLAERIERSADNTLKSADWFWGWRRRDRALSVAFGALSRDLRGIAAALRAIANQQKDEHDV
jgi:hypothetical protein